MIYLTDSEKIIEKMLDRSCILNGDDRVKKALISEIEELCERLHIELIEIDENNWYLTHVIHEANLKCVKLNVDLHLCREGLQL